MAIYTLESLYSDNEYQTFLQELFVINGTFNVDYNLENAIEYIKQTPYGFGKIRLIDEVRRINSLFRTKDDYKIEGKKVLGLLTYINKLEDKSSSLLESEVNKFGISEARPVLSTIIRKPRIQIINRLKQNKFLTLTKVFDYSYIHYLLSPFIDNISVDYDYKIEYQVEIDESVKLNNKNTDEMIWIRDISYTSFSEIIRYFSLVDKVIYKKGFVSITTPYDTIILYLNWKERNIDKSESIQYISNLLTLRSNFDLGYISYSELKKHLNAFYIPVDIELIKKPVREIITDTFIKNVLFYNLVSFEKLKDILYGKLDDQDRKTVSNLNITNINELISVTNKLELKYHMLYQELFKEVLKC